MPAQYALSEMGNLPWPVFAPAQREAPVPHVALDRSVCVVGARVLVHLPLDSQEVSKAHALIVQEADGVYIRDLASKNRTFVNGVPVKEKRLSVGDNVRIGPFQYLCRQGFDGSGEPQHIPQGEIRMEADGLTSRQIVSVEKQTFLIGSRDGCDLQLAGDDVALAHAVMFVRNGRRYLRDLSSHTGTFVNQQRIREIELADEAEIRIGEHYLRYYPLRQKSARQAEVANIDSDDTVIGEPANKIPLPWDDVEVA